MARSGWQVKDVRIHALAEGKQKVWPVHLVLFAGIPNVD